MQQRLTRARLKLSYSIWFLSAQSLLLRTFRSARIRPRRLAHLGTRQKKKKKEKNKKEDPMIFL